MENSIIMAKRAKKKLKKTARRASGGVSGRLGESQDDWEGAEPRSFGAPLPDGQYEGIIENAIIEESRNGRLQARWDLLVTEGDCEGRQIRKYNGLETKDNLAWFKGDLETLDLTVPDDFTDIGDTLEEACGMGIRFQVRSRDEFTNIDFIEPLETTSKKDKKKEEEPEEPSYTKAQVKKMDEDELTAAAKEFGLDPDDYDEWDDLADAIIDEL